jgi:predicted amidohydrolase
MKVATAAYPLDWLDSWAAYEDKLVTWVSDAAAQGAELLVFPEYGAMELATLDGAEVAADLERSLHAVSDRLGDADQVHMTLAAEHGVHILAASGPALTDKRPVNRARLITPTGQIGVQDKQIMTRGERDPMAMQGGGPLQVFDTALGKIGVLICYDSEFPLLGRALAEAEIILVPSCTRAVSGYSRVRIGSQATALANQCVTVMSSLVGKMNWAETFNETTGAGGVFGPPDVGFPEDGVMGLGTLGAPAWTYAEIDRDAIAHVRRDGGVLNASHWPEQSGREAPAVTVNLKA